jgi:hypothetical protein
VPRISFFYGIAIYMYWDEGEHARPHFHARYAGEAASIDLAGDVIAGSLPRRALALVGEWAGLHREELLANWERARRNEPLQVIDPLP